MPTPCHKHAICAVQLAFCVREISAAPQDGRYEAHDLVRCTAVQVRAAERRAHAGVATISYDGDRGSNVHGTGDRASVHRAEKVVQRRREGQTQFDRALGI